jgi:hypothetical protein
MLEYPRITMASFGSTPSIFNSDACCVPQIMKPDRANLAP